MFHAAGGESFHVKTFDTLILSDHFQSQRTHEKFEKSFMNAEKMWVTLDNHLKILTREVVSLKGHMHKIN